MMLTNLHSLKKVTLACITALCLMQVYSAEATPPPVMPDRPAQRTDNQQDILASLPAGYRPFYLHKLSAIYSGRHAQPVWQDSEAVKQFQQQLAEVALSGVQPQFGHWITLLASPEITGLARDVVLSDAMLGYLQFVSGIPANGEEWLYSRVPYRMALPPESPVSLWLKSVNDGQLGAFITSLAPQHPQYVPMQAALKTLLSDQRPWPSLKEKASLRPGDVSDDIPALREILRRSGMLPDDTAESALKPVRMAERSSQADSNGQTPVIDNTADSGTPSVVSVSAVPVASQVYDKTLSEAVKRFQRWQGLEADGSIGARTHEWLNVSPQMRASLLALNMQRLRLLPDDMRHGIMVNIANFSLAYYVNGKEILASRVIVGRADRKTPLMRSALSNVVLNPPWNAPTTLVRKDIVPKIKRDPAYLAKHGYTLLSGWNDETQVVDPSTINWSTVSASSFPYRIRQSPGSINSLGRYKFNMPSSNAIYLHDTPNHALFQKDIRTLSSGCVRINRAADLANLLLRDVGWDAGRIANTLKRGETVPVSIRHRVPVNLYYLTAWVADDGTPQFRTDIYNYDIPARTGMKFQSDVASLLL